MSLFHKSKPQAQAGTQVFMATPVKSRQKLATGVAAIVLVVVLVIAAGLLLGRLWSHRTVNTDTSGKASSEQRVNQSPQGSQAPATPQPASSAGSGQLNH